MIFCKLFARPITEKLEHQLQLPMITNYCSKKGRDRRVKIIAQIPSFVFCITVFCKFILKNVVHKKYFFLKMYAC